MYLKGQSVLESLMSYGWALIAIAMAIGAIVFVASGSTESLNCQSGSTRLVLESWEVATGNDGVSLVLQNATGEAISSIEATSGAGFQAETIAITGSIDAASNFALQNLSGPASRGNIGNGKININFATSVGQDENIVISCSGTV